MLRQNYSFVTEPELSNPESRIVQPKEIVSCTAFGLAPGDFLEGQNLREKRHFAIQIINRKLDALDLVYGRACGEYREEQDERDAPGSNEACRCR